MKQCLSKFSKKKAGQQGFTLIELMIVIAIIGILAAISILQYKSFMVRSQNKATLSDVRNLATDLHGFAADYQIYPH